jgi:hypothetical protein
MKSQPVFLNYIRYLSSSIAAIIISTITVLAQYPNNVPVSCASFIPSPEFKVVVDGKDVLVYSSPVPLAFCSFEMSKPVDIVVRSLRRDIKWADIRPLSSGIRPVIKSDSTIAFHITTPGQFSIELNGIFKIPLFIFANKPESEKPQRTDKNVLYFESGKIHYPGTIILNDNQQVFIESGAIVAGCIKARDVNHIKIWGGGILDGSYSRHFMDSCAAVYNNGLVREPFTGGINGLISITESSDVTIQGLTLFNSKSWDVVPSLCNNVKIINVKIISDNNSDDGIDIVSTRNISIMNSFIRTKDDCIAIKSFAKPQPLSVHKSPERVFGQVEDGPFYQVDSVSVENCVFWNAEWGNALEIGFELSGDIRNVSFKNNDIIRVEGGAAFSIHNARRGVVSNILVDGLRVENTDQKLFDLAIFRSVYSEDGTGDDREVRRLYLNGIWDNVLSVTEKEKDTHSKFRGHINGVTLKNVSIVDGPVPFSVFYGSDNTHLVENVTIEGLTFYGKNIKDISEAKLYLENAKNIRIK